jgi:hypothetical protein
LRNAANSRFQLEMGLVELAQVPRMRSLEELIADFSRLVKERTPGGAGHQAAGTPASQPRSRPAPAAGEPLPSVPPVHAAAAPAPSPPAAPPSSPEPQPAAPAADEGQASRELLEQIAGAVHKESLEANLRSLPTARLRGDSVILDLELPVNEFLRRQLKDNLPAIAQAASQVLGRTVQVLLGDAPAASDAGPAPAGSAAGDARGENVLERARKDPAVQSFLDIFPGPIKTEKL